MAGVPESLSGGHARRQTAAETGLLATSYYGSTSARYEALNQIKDDLGPNEENFKKALAGLTLGAPSGDIKLDANRQAIGACHEESWLQSGLSGEGLAPITDFRVHKSIKLLSDAAGSEIALDSIAREAGRSRPQFYKLFRAQTGVTPHLYLNTLLMEKALDALVTTDAPIAEIGGDLGFSSLSVFARFFAGHVGIAPTDYRRAAKVLRN